MVIIANMIAEVSTLISITPKLKQARQFKNSVTSNGLTIIQELQLFNGLCTVAGLTDITRSLFSLRILEMVESMFAHKSNPSSSTRTT